LFGESPKNDWYEDSKRKVVIARRNDEAIFHASDPCTKDCFVGLKSLLAMTILEYENFISVYLCASVVKKVYEMLTKKRSVETQTFRLNKLIFFIL